MPARKRKGVDYQRLLELDLDTLILFIFLPRENYTAYNEKETT